MCSEGRRGVAIPRRFLLRRVDGSETTTDGDVEGTSEHVVANGDRSGTDDRVSVVAFGTAFADGCVVLRWRNDALGLATAANDVSVFPAPIGLDDLREVFASRERDVAAEYALVWIDPTADDARVPPSLGDGTEDDDPQAPPDLELLG